MVKIVNSIDDLILQTHLHAISHLVVTPTLQCQVLGRLNGFQRPPPDGQEHSRRRLSPPFSILVAYSNRIRLQAPKLDHRLYPLVAIGHELVEIGLTPAQGVQTDKHVVADGDVQRP